MVKLTEGKEGKVILRFAMPMLIGNVFQQLYNVVDSVIVGNFLGKEALSAVGASFPIIFALISLIIGIAMGSTIMISQFYGAKDYEKLSRTIDTMFIWLFFGAILISLVGIYFSEAIFRMIDLPEEIMPQAVPYLQIVMGGSLVMFGFNATSGVLRGLGDSKTPLYFLILSTLVNIVLDLLFVLVFDWGIEGVAIATVLAQGGAFLTAVIYLNRHHEIINISFLNLTFDKKIFIQSLKIGLPSGLQHMFVAVGMTALFRIVNMFGTNVIAAYSVAGRIDSFAMMPAMNFAMAFSTFVGQNIGANKIQRVKNGLIAVLKMTSIISVTLSLVAFFFGKYLIAFFIDEQIIIDIGARYLLIVGGFYIVFSIMFSFNAIFRGAGDTLIPMFITLMALWGIRIPISYYLSLEMGEEGIWWGIPLAWVFGAVVSILYFFTGRWKNKAVVNFDKE